MAKAKSIIPTYTNNFLTDAATSVHTEMVPVPVCCSVPKEDVPCPTNLLVQSSSIGQDSNAAAVPPAQEYTADSDQTLFPTPPCGYSGVLRAYHYFSVPYSDWSLQPIFLLLLPTT